MAEYTWEAVAAPELLDARWRRMSQLRGTLLHALTGGTVKYKPADDITWEPAPTEFFDGKAWFGPMGEPEDPNGLLTLGVLFEPGARTHWHHHPGGQTLYIVSGAGHVGKDDGERVSVSAGDVVSVPPGEVHWHGASEASYMMHLSLTTGGQTIWETGEVGYAAETVQEHVEASS